MLFAINGDTINNVRCNKACTIAAIPPTGTVTILIREQEYRVNTANYSIKKCV